MIPSVREWHQTYRDQGLVVIGNHFPEFSHERDIANLRAAMERLDVPYAVAQDNDGATWNAYNNRYWPSLYLIDKRGHIRYRHIGEGAYDETESAIQDLLLETYTEAIETSAVLPSSLTPTVVLNVRSAPGTGSPLVGAIHPGEAFVIRGQQDGWYIINYNGLDGYVSGEFVTVQS